MRRRWTFVLALVSAVVLAVAVLTAGGPTAGHHVLPAAAMAPNAPTLPRTGWTASASDEEIIAGQFWAANVLDGDNSTFWHSRFRVAPASLPHSITIDMHRIQVVSALVYLPRPGGGNGTIGGYEIRLSHNGVTWTSPVAIGTLADTASVKTLSFPAQATRFVRLIATSEAGDRGPWSSAAELNLLGDPGTLPGLVELPRAGWAVAGTDSGDGRGVLDGDPATFWQGGRWITLDMGARVTVSALRYQPRRDGVGRIGSYTVEASTDGVEFNPVAAGRWSDDELQKSTTFAPVIARFVRLSASSDAGASEIALSAPANPAVAGLWGEMIGFPIVPVATATLPGNKMLAWSAVLADDNGGSWGSTETALLDLGSGAVSRRRVFTTGHDMFCPGTAQLADGRLMVTGGSNSDKTSIYTPATDSWQAGPRLRIPRGYQGMTALPDGGAFVLGGSWSGGNGGKHGEVWSSSGWRELPGVRVDRTLTDDPQGIYRSDNHGWYLAASGGRIFHAGPSRSMHWISTAGEGSLTDAGPRGDSQDAMNGNAVLYDVGKILTVGGATAYQDAPATRRAYTVDINGAQPVVQRVADLGHARTFGNSVVLPDGKVFVVGGQAHAAPFSDEASAMTPELWDPATGEFTPMATMAVPRNYHSVANLLPDGRIFSGGGGLCGRCTTNHFDGQIFTPPYLLNPDGTPRDRPILVTAPRFAAPGAVVSVRTDRPVTAFSLVRMGAVTHSVNNDQRRVPLPIVSSAGTTYSLSVPADRGVALPGEYLLFALDAAGTPSVAATIHIG
ncbi:discoidin domain-containing protein [Lentzea sp. E54]|uniref:discoidin domain-containing protein n=1 Tax=Lentzea xerophila TaxID=3435883 RepID=UPI003DA3A048